MTNPHNAYREGAARGASPVGQVVMLYEQVIEDLRRAGNAVDENNIELRTNAINHAIVVIDHLHGNLDLDAGGDVARNLQRFYTMLRTKLMEAQFKASREILDEQIGFLLDLRGAWIEVDRATSAPPVAPAQPAPAVPDASPHPTGEWNA